MLEDSYRHKGLRRRLMEELQQLKITDKNVLTAMGVIPRHFFMDTAFLSFAYTNKAFPIDAGQTISQPYTVAMQSSLLACGPKDKVLEVGTGSGYQTAVLCELGCNVFSIERQRTLFTKTKKLLQKLRYEAYLVYGDGYKGLDGYAPFDGILVTCGAPEVPKSLLKQLKIGGKLVVPINTNNDFQIMKRFTKTADNQYLEEDYGSFKFVPMLPNRNDF